MVATQPVALVANKCSRRTLSGRWWRRRRSAAPLDYTSPGPRGVGHLAGEMLKQRAGIEMMHINYNGSAPALTDMVAGRVPLMFDIWHSAKRYVDSGELKLIAGAGEERFADKPQRATMAETYPGFHVMAFNALVTPAGVPQPVLEKLSADIRAVVSSEAFAREDQASRHHRLWQYAGRALGLDADQIARWQEVAKAANIQAD